METLRSGFTEPCDPHHAAAEFVRADRRCSGPRQPEAGAGFSRVSSWSSTAPVLAHQTDPESAGQRPVLSAALSGTTVSLNGIAAPILYTSETQVAAIVPYAVSGSTARVDGEPTKVRSPPT